MKCLGKMYGQGDGRCGAGSRDGGEIVGAAVSSAYLVCGAVGSELDATGRPSGEGGGGGAGGCDVGDVGGVSGRVVAGSGGLVGRAVGSELNDAVVVSGECGGCGAGG